jgi:colanic acid biosynthesis glycosyl transferase WcaI
MSSNKRILVIGLNYAPDLIGIAKYTTELCEDLVRRGWEVEVVTAPPYYPAWCIPDEYRGRRRGHELVKGVRLWRAPIYVPAQPSGIKRLVHLASFALGALPLALVRARATRPQVVFTVAPALLSAPTALVAGKLVGAATWLHVQDFELDAAFNLGFLKSPLMRSLGAAFERAVFKAFDRVSTISPKMVERLITSGVAPACTTELRNWVDMDSITAWPSSDTPLRRQLGIKSDVPVLLYSGNMAAKQGLDLLAETARRFHVRRKRGEFLFVGQGPYRSELARLCEGLPNVHFLPLQPASAVDALLATADIHLLPQRREAADLVLPSKLAAMLASGRPSVVMADPGTGLAVESEGAALIVSPGDREGFEAAVDRLAGDSGLRHTLGRTARQLAEARWRKQEIIDRFEATVRLSMKPQ